MRNLRILAALGLVASASIASADVTSTVYAVSDYDFRGASQSATDPAFQASIDYATDSGLTVGAWGSNVDFGAGDQSEDVNFEVDIYGGFAGEINDKVGWDAGVVYYSYPEEGDFNYAEIYGGISAGLFKAKLWYSNEFLGDVGEDLANGGDTDAFYIEGNVTVPLPEKFSLLLHAGLSTGSFFDDAIGDDVVDYSVGVGYVAGPFNLTLKFIGNDTGDVPEVESDVFNQEKRVLFMVQTTFPWSN